MYPFFLVQKKRTIFIALLTYRFILLILKTLDTYLEIIFTIA
ncbi:protein of unknown function [Streptococcus thermophilus]|nr:protein of unknown function [Streptococcus thermophilus]CAD0151625.1 protein of unknown function [Streptococcus thermophilus]